MDARVAHERGADVALARQQRERLGRHARLAQRLHQHRRATRRLLGRLEDHGVAGREPAATMPSGIATGKFHGEITATTPRGE